MPSSSFATMPTGAFSYLLEQPCHNAAIEQINEEAFGPGRFTRAAHLIREGGGHDPALSFVAMDADELVASVRMTPVCIGAMPAWLLGPIVVRSGYKSAGIGKELMKRALEAATKTETKLVILVGDAPYYERFGFHVLPAGKVTMPAPVDPARFLGFELQPGALQQAEGRVRHA